MNDLSFLKEQINKNDEIKSVLKKYSDDFLIKNQSIILAALDSNGINDGYKVKIIIKNNIVDWTYVPINKQTQEIEISSKISSNYLLKLPKDLIHMYLIDLNNVKWTEDKRNVAKECKTIIDNVKKNIMKGSGFWLYGPNNSGKTFLSIALLNSISKHNKKVSFVNVAELVSYLKKDMNSYEENSNQIIEKLKNADVIIIDDLGVERTSNWFKESVLFPIIDYRFMSGKITIFNSNFSLHEYAQKISVKSKGNENSEKLNSKIISRISKLINNKEIKIG